MDKPPISSVQLDLRISKQDLEPKKYWEEIGYGSFATVYKAYCKKHNGFVAVKELFKEYRDVQQKEIDKLVQLSTHIHVVGIKGVDPDRNLIIMEYCSYSLSKLRKTLGKTYIPWPRCLYFMQQIMSGVEFLHDNHIIHRDIKLENVMVTDSFVCKIADLGLAKHESSHTNSNKDSFIIQPSGSMFYISPERWNSPADPAKESDDIYSCGMVFFKMITNGNLFESENLPWDESVVSNLKHYLKGPWRESFIEQLGNDCPVIVKDVLKSCWHKEPVKRRTCKSWADSLRNYIRDEVNEEDLAKADEKLKDLLKGGKSRTRHGISQSPATPLSDRASAGGEERDYRDSPTDDDPPTTDDDPPTIDDDPPTTVNDPPTTSDDPPTIDDDPPTTVDDPPIIDDDPPTTVNKEVSSAYPEGLTGRYADGASFHLEAEMSNLTVEGKYTDVFVLSGGNDVIECHGLQTNTSYKLYLQKDTGELCFIKVPIGSDGNEKRIPLRRIQTIVKNKKERILTLQVRVAGRTQVQNVTLSVSSLDTLCADLRACGVCVNEDHDNSVKADAKCRYYRQQTQDSHLQDEPTQHCSNSQPFQQNRSPNMQPPPHAGQPLNQRQNLSHHGQSQYQPEFNQNRQPTSSQASPSINYINHIENFYNGPTYHQGGPPNT